MSRYLVNLKKGNDYLVPSVLGGVDTTNVLASRGIVSSTSYTATEDCILFLYDGSQYGEARIDNVNLINTSTNKLTYLSTPLKKNQVFSIATSGSGAYIKVFGLKY